MGERNGTVASKQALIRWCLTKLLAVANVTIDIAPGIGRGKKKEQVSD